MSRMIRNIRIFLIFMIFSLNFMWGEVDFSLTPLEIDLADVVRSTLENQWNIHLAEEDVEQQCGIYQSTHGVFNSTLESRLDQTWRHQLQARGVKTTKDGYLTSFDLAVTKLDPLGTETSFGTAIDRDKNEVTLFPFKRENIFTLFFTIDQPLLRRFIYNDERANEIISCMELKALKWELIQTIAAQVRESVQRYWDLAFAKELLGIREESMKRREDIAISTQSLIEGGQMASSELNQQYAEIFVRKRQEENAEQGVYAAYNNLIFAMGGDVEEHKLPRDCQVPELVLEKFPELDKRKKNCQGEHLFELASKNRGDLIAAKWRIESSHVLLKTASNSLLPEVNLTGRVDVRNHSVNTKAKSFLGATWRRRPQSDWTAGVTFSYPLCNDEAKGDYRRRLAENTQAYIEEDQLFANIQTDIATALRNHFSLVDQLHFANESVKWFERTLEDEKRRLKEGYSTLFVVLDFEDRLSDAMIDRLSVYTAYAQNLVDLLFFTGTLVQPDEELKKMYLADVKTIEHLFQRN